MSLILFEGTVAQVPASASAPFGSGSTILTPNNRIQLSSLQLHQSGDVERLYDEEVTTLQDAIGSQSFAREAWPEGVILDSARIGGDPAFFLFRREPEDITTGTGELTESGEQCKSTSGSFERWGTVNDWQDEQEEDDVVAESPGHETVSSQESVEIVMSWLADGSEAREIRGKLQYESTDCSALVLPSEGLLARDSVHSFKTLSIKKVGIFPSERPSHEPYQALIAIIYEPKYDHFVSVLGAGLPSPETDTQDR
ncbi:hypothetical protein BD324DRAFT_160954 [Kockovaella imperatae]|uniref:Uncharacterized protein n=1 Tax=Kockovaella imperatae TaxID=4999 RepID=A0A1Y1UAJ2_9TREE|nr:hypothetical protein BD324DRAFT_160954 [Kockovaella imperatae]ORX34564.1 hypothetical protein BD324DRAFT_160954 [Kockovaella imperatae]